MNEMLTMNDGTILKNSRALEADGNLYIHIRNGSGIKDVFDTFIDKEKAKKITFSYYGAEDLVFTGYTKVISVRDNGMKHISVVLEKELMTEAEDGTD